MEFNQEKYETLLAQLGLVKKEKPAELDEEQKAMKVVELLEVLEGAKANKDEKLAKKVRRILRKTYGFKISEHKKVVL